MNMKESADTYQTIAANAEGVYKEKGSKFIALAFPVSDEGEIKGILANLRKEYHDARHHCYAYSLGYSGNQWRANDDGEPSGTAGRPIYGQILSKNITNVLIVVIRYFGGTKLGVSGLINAYKTAAADALGNAKIITKTINDIYQISFNFIALNDMMKMIKDESLDLISQQFNNDCLIEVGIRKSKVDGVLSRIGKIESASIRFIKTI